jgi:hypothetical protein
VDVSPINVDAFAFLNITTDSTDTDCDCAEDLKKVETTCLSRLFVEKVAENVSHAVLVQVGRLCHVRVRWQC